MFGVRSAKAFSYRRNAKRAVDLRESRRIDVLLFLQFMKLVDLVARTGGVPAGRVGDTQPRPRQGRGSACDSSLGDFGLRKGFLAVPARRAAARAVNPRRSKR